MRADAIGLFWQDLPAKKGERVINRIMPDIPHTGWTAPRDFPRLDAAPWVAFDLEVKDPNLLTHGPGWARGDGHIVGIAVAAPGYASYFPIRHEVKPEENLDPEHVLAWARDQLGIRRPTIGANLMYDIGWASQEGIKCAGPFYDVQFAEALLDEAAKVNLNALGEKYLGVGKETSLLYQWSADYYGGQPTEKQRANIWRCPPSLVGPYATTDVTHPSRILPYQWARLQTEGLVDLFEMECRLIPLLIAMRRAGVSVDINRANEVLDRIKGHVKTLEHRMKDLVGFEVNVDAHDSMKKAFNSLGIPLPLKLDKDTQEHKVSFEKGLLQDIDHEFVALVREIKKQTKVADTFVQSYILEKHVKGKVHCQFHPLRGDEGGTRSGRFSSSDPNYQNVPARDEELAPLVRGLFIPDPGHAQWRRYDYDQIEYRFNAHYAVGPGSDALRLQYNTDPATDYHVNTQKLVAAYTGTEIPRKPIKNFNFGMTYGMGRAKLLSSLRVELAILGSRVKFDPDQLYDAYHEAVPFTRATLEHFASLAKSVGYVCTILGRRSRFDLWEPDIPWDERKAGPRQPALPYTWAVSKYGKVKRAFSHKALNRVLQGSSADMMKRAMLTCWESGVFDVVGVPRLTVHDELDFSDPGGNLEAWVYIQHTLEHCIPLRIPVIASLDIGKNWGEASS